MEDIIIEERPVPSVSKKEPVKVVEKKVKIKVKKQGPGVLSYWADWFNKSLIVFLLAALDFILFCGAGNLNIFRGAPWEFILEAQYILVGLFILSWLLMFAASLARFIQNLLAAGCVFLFVVIIMNQFALFDKASFLQAGAAEWLGNSAAGFLSAASQWFVAGVAAVAAWLFFTFAGNRKQFYAVVLLSVVFLTMTVKLYNRRNSMEAFHQLYADKVITANKKGNNFVFIAVPNLPSYRYLEKISPKYTAARSTLNAMLGLYTRNGFILFPNAYTTGKNEAENLAQSLNMSNEDGLLGQHAVYENAWDFGDIATLRPELKRNKVFETFEKNGYVRKVFEDRNMELCFIGGKPSANSCLRRGMVPFAVDAEKFTLRQRVMLLLGQWLGSMDIFSLNRPLYNVLKSFNVADVPLVGIDYAKVNALGSVGTLDVVADDIASGRGNRAYFVWMNLPEQGYVYDEFCQLKPVDKWILEDGVSVSEDKKVNAYFEQTSCLFGKLADFVRKLKEADADKNTVVVLQGVSGLEIAGLKPADKFEAERMVSMAIRDPKHNKFTLNRRFCSTPKIVRQYLFKKDLCVEQEGLNIDENLKKEVLKNIEKHNVFDKTSIDTLTEAGEWFRSWLRANYQDMVIPIEMPVLADKEVEASKLQDPQQAKEKNVPQDLKTIGEVSREEAAKQIKEIKLHTGNVVAEKAVDAEEKAESGKPEADPSDAVSGEGTANVAESEEIAAETGEAAKELEVVAGEAEKDLEEENAAVSVQEEKREEKVVIIPQGDDKADKIIIKIGEDDDASDAGEGKGPTMLVPEPETEKSPASKDEAQQQPELNEDKLFEQNDSALPDIPEPKSQDIEGK